MRATGPLLIVLGLASLFWGWASMGTGVVAEGLDLSVRNVSRDLAEQLSTAELARALGSEPADVPVDETARIEWVEDRLARNWSRAMRRYAGATAAICIVVGVACIAWGSAENRAWRRRERRKQ